MMAYTGGSALKGYPFQASGVGKGKDFASWSIWKRETSVILVYNKAQKDLQMHFMAVKKVNKTFWFEVCSYLKESA